ncbi:MAG: sulfotransferase [Oscillatoria sp. PMC 1068.18]|nr:sulfotransferase [Oscillatoria sp. PMC 1076.18]MEC4987924.1 sulfotransferase [Oscillatoria sp. PMC 1068.18]
MLKNFKHQLQVKNDPISNLSWRLYRKIQPSRRFQLFCVGTPRSGTHSIHALFAENYRSWHEPYLPQLYSILSKKHLSEISFQEISQWLLSRDFKLWLEVEASHPLNFLVAELATTFPEAKFILTVREPVSWLKSEINKNLGTEGKLWRDLEKFRYGNEAMDYEPEERFLRDYGVYPTANYFKYWTQHNQRVLSTVNRENLLIVKTAEIPQSVARIARFIGIPAETLAVQKSHVSASGSDRPIPQLVLAEEFLATQAERYCGELYAQLLALKKNFSD